ncbi:MAG: type I-U CRISPR-associated protein Csb2 [Acidobacteriota bacterium]|jgi:CRISPR-associated protein Csb2
MSLIIEQYFPLGRFHATRWNQNPFEDPYGEWPPSPWRLLRALAARWIQYSRETGDEDRQARDELLRVLAAEVPGFFIPTLTLKGLPWRQYQPSEIKFSKKKEIPEVKKAVRSLVLDNYRAIPRGEPIYWIWPSLRLNGTQEILLRELLSRVLYFGRSESFCQFGISDVAEDVAVNCTLLASSDRGVPVLVANPGVDLDIAVLLAATDDKLIARRRIPPGTSWYYAQVPQCPAFRPTESPMFDFPDKLTVIQFALGGRVYPPPELWVKITERFRGRVLRLYARRVTGNVKAAYRDLTSLQRNEIGFLSGKDAEGRALEGHRHAHFALWPDVNGLPTRLICWRNTPFLAAELNALLSASERPYSWETGSADWTVRLVPLPFETPPPSGFDAESTSWVSATPFVVPGNRRRFRANGRARPGETTERLIVKLLRKSQFPEPVAVIPMDDTNGAHWVLVHESYTERKRRSSERSTVFRLGCKVRITFPHPVRGPICLGHSSHFGLGLFVPHLGDLHR